MIHAERWQRIPPVTASCTRHSTRHSSRDRQLRYLAAYVRGGSQKVAAHDLGLSEQTIKNVLSDLYCELDVYSVIGALVKLGWLQVPSTQTVGGSVTITVWP